MGKSLPGAEKSHGAPGSTEKTLPGAEKNPGPFGSGCLRTQVDQVHFQGVYQVHQVWLWRAFGAGVVDLVQDFKVDQVHPAFPPDFPFTAASGKRKVTTRGSECPQRPS